MAPPPRPPLPLLAPRPVDRRPLLVLWRLVRDSAERSRWPLRLRRREPEERWYYSVSFFLVEPEKWVPWMFRCDFAMKA